jgi:hypothetical protein
MSLYFLNIGPARSGTTSLYDMLGEHPQIDKGKMKEPNYNGYRIPLDPIHYLSNWDSFCYINSKEIKVLIDASPALVYFNENLNLKKDLSSHISKYKFICVIRNPIKYFSTRLFFAYIIKYLNKELNPKIDKFEFYKYSFDSNFDYTKINFNHVEEGLDFSIIENKWRDLKTISYLECINKARRIFDKNEIFILPIEHINSYLPNLLNFLELEHIDLKCGVLNKNLNFINAIKGFNSAKKKISLLKLYTLINNKVIESKVLNQMIINEFNVIDKEYGTQLNEIYFR